MRNIVLILFFFVSKILCLYAQPTQVETWKGFKLENFSMNGIACKIAFPKKLLPTKNWIWRTQFWGHEPQVDSTLLSMGYSLAYVNLEDLYGSPVSMKRMNEFYDIMQKKYHLNSKVVLEGFSRGGLDALNWASKNTNKVACIYVDAPVCDIKSWPGGLGKGRGSKDDWQKCLSIYGLTNASVLLFKDIPINNVKNVALAKIPIISVCGDADDVVPLPENTVMLEKTVLANGGIIKTIIKKGVGHHPHSLVNPQAIIDFVIKSEK